MDLDAALLGKVIETGDLQPLLKASITADHFIDVEYRVLYSHLIEHSNTYNEVPTEELVREVFPDVDLTTTADSAEALVDQVKYRRAHNELANVVNDLAVQATEDALGTIRSMPGHASRLLLLANDSTQDIDITQDTEEIWARYQRAKAGKLAAMSYPFPSLQRVTLGIHPGQFIVLYGKEKTMKTWIMQVIAKHVHTVNRRRPVFVSQEMEAWEIQQRAVALYCGVNYQQLREGKLPTRAERDFQDNLHQWRENEPFIVTHVSQRGEEALATLEAKCIEHNADIAFFDGIYLAADRLEELIVLTRGLKRLAKKLKIPIIGSCQENADGQTMYSRSFQQDADMLLRTVRGKDEERNNEVKIYVPMMREAAFHGFTVSAFPAYSFEEKHDVGAEDERNNNFEEEKNDRPPPRRQIK